MHIHARQNENLSSIPRLGLLITFPSPKARAGRGARGCGPSPGVAVCTVCRHADVQDADENRGVGHTSSVWFAAWCAWEGKAAHHTRTREQLDAAERYA